MVNTTAGILTTMGRNASFITSWFPARKLRPVMVKRRFTPQPGLSEAKPGIFFVACISPDLASLDPGYTIRNENLRTASHCPRPWLHPDPCLGVELLSARDPC